MSWTWLGWIVLSLGWIELGWVGSGRFGFEGGAIAGFHFAPSHLACSLQHGLATRRNFTMVNLDPAAENFKYPVSIGEISLSLTHSLIHSLSLTLTHSLSLSLSLLSASQNTRGVTATDDPQPLSAPRRASSNNKPHQRHDRYSCPLCKQLTRTRRVCRREGACIIGGCAGRDRLWAKWRTGLLL